MTRPAGSESKSYEVGRVAIRAEGRMITARWCPNFKDTDGSYEIGSILRAAADQNRELYVQFVKLMEGCFTTIAQAATGTTPYYVSQRPDKRAPGRTVRYHQSVAVAHLLNYGKSLPGSLAGTLSVEGVPLDHGAAMAFLEKRLDAGDVVIPLATCEGFDYSGGGCPGHSDPDPSTGVEHESKTSQPAAGDPGPGDLSPGGTPAP